MEKPSIFAAAIQALPNKAFDNAKNPHTKT